MFARNHSFRFRPLIGGIFVLNPANSRPGTLGLVAARSDGSRYLVSAYHVLCRPAGAPFNEGEPIEQPIGAENAVARVFRADTDPTLDVAAARIDAMVSSEGRILGLPPLAAPSAPTINMEVIKSGATTGVTEGRITEIDGTRVVINRPAGSSSLYEVSGFGDSGAIWIDRETGSPIGIHLATDSQGEAVALEISVALASLKLEVFRRQ